METEYNLHDYLSQSDLDKLKKVQDNLQVIEALVEENKQILGSFSLDIDV